jgi:tetratricopeptide (TPR) repeat protein
MVEHLQVVEEALARFHHGDLVGALRCIGTIAEHHPANPAVLFFNAMVAYHTHEKRPAQALALAQRLLEEAAVRCRRTEVYSNLGLVYRHQGQHGNALRAQVLSLEVQPTVLANVEAGICAAALGRHDLAAPYFRAALAMAPESNDAILAQSGAHFCLGNHAEAYRLHEIRLDMPLLKLLPTMGAAWTRWDGTTTVPVLFFSEQGYGDTVQMLRYLPRLQQLLPRVGVVVRTALAPLVSAQFPGVEVVAEGDDWPVGYQHYASLFSLVHLVGFPPPAEPILPRARRVAISWRGSPSHRNTVNRDCPLLYWDPLLTLPGVEWVVVGVDGREAELGELPVVPTVLSGITDWEATRHALERVDAVVSVDTSLAHLAGAMGIPTAVLLSADPDHRWGLHGSTTPWYPTWHLCRQPMVHDWPAAMAHAVDWLLPRVAA